MPDYLENIVVDFDDTICPFNEDFSCRSLVPGARKYIIKLRRAGYIITVSSARNNLVHGGHEGMAHQRMCRALHEYEIPYDRIDRGLEGKPVAYRYIDDKGVGCPRTKEGWVDWPKVYELITGET